jgi:hypothetical protein
LCVREESPADVTAVTPADVVLNVIAVGMAIGIGVDVVADRLATRAHRQ